MKSVPFVRDRRSPNPKSLSVSRIMSANKAKNTGPELLLRRALRVKSIRGYRLHPSNVPGRPDIVFASKKVAIFVHGCYWHHCSKCNFQLPRHNSVFWRRKFKRNQERDKEKRFILRRSGWKTIVIWEHDLNSNPHKAAQKIISRLP